MKVMDNGKCFEVIDNRNYSYEPKWLFATYYYVGSNPIRAIVSLLVKR